MGSRCSLNYANATQQCQSWFCPLLRTAPMSSRRSILVRWATSRNRLGMRSCSALFSWCLRGGIYIPPEILAREHLSHPAVPSAGGRAIVSPADLGLTDRQLDVLALMMQGKNNKSICSMLNLAEPTVKNHVTAILKALKVTNRTEAVIA